MRAFTLRSWFGHKQEQWSAPFKTLLLATLLGLSWFPLASISSFLGSWLAELIFHYHRTPGQPIDNPFLLCAYLMFILLSAVFYLGLVPPVLGFRFGDFPRFLRCIGLIGMPRFGLINVSIALVAVGILLLSHVFPLFILRSQGQAPVFRHVVT